MLDKVLFWCGAVTSRVRCMCERKREEEEESPSIVMLTRFLFILPFVDFIYLGGGASFLNAEWEENNDASSPPLSKRVEEDCGARPPRKNRPTKQSAISCFSSFLRKSKIKRRPREKTKEPSVWRKELNNFHFRRITSFQSLSLSLPLSRLTIEDAEKLRFSDILKGRVGVFLRNECPLNQKNSKKLRNFWQ